MQQCTSMRGAKDWCVNVGARLKQVDNSTADDMPAQSCLRDASLDLPGFGGLLRGASEV